MKKLLYILATMFAMASCYDENIPVSQDNGAIRIEGNIYNVYKVELENHTYILLHGYYRLALEHDPECPYCKEHGFPEHKLETTDY